MTLIDFLKLELSEACEPEYEKLIQDLIEEYNSLVSVSDTCTVCGCNEFLCGHNKRG